MNDLSWLDSGYIDVKDKEIYIGDKLVREIGILFTLVAKQSRITINKSRLTNNISVCSKINHQIDDCPLCDQTCLYINSDNLRTYSDSMNLYIDFQALVDNSDS